MEVLFKNKKMKKICEDEQMLVKKYGKQSKIIIQRITELSSALSLYDISKLPKARLHSLSGNLDGYFAVDLYYPYRLIFLPLNGNSKNLRSVNCVKIIEIINYH